jgi:hypothetical protein
MTCPAQRPGRQPAAIGHRPGPDTARASASSPSAGPGHAARRRGAASAASGSVISRRCRSSAAGSRRRNCSRRQPRRFARTGRRQRRSRRLLRRPGWALVSRQCRSNAGSGSCPPATCPIALSADAGDLGFAPSRRWRGILERLPPVPGTGQELADAYRLCRDTSNREKGRSGYLQPLARSGEVHETDPAMTQPTGPASPWRATALLRRGPLRPARRAAGPAAVPRRRPLAQQDSP